MHDTDSRVSRREVLRLGLCGTVCAGLAGCEIDKNLSGPDETGVTVEITDYPALETIGGAARITLDGVNEGRPVMVVRTASAAVAVLSAVCTHQGCLVDLPDPGSETLRCPCHASSFAIDTGEVLGGPAPAPLAVFRSAFDAADGRVTVYG